MNNKEEQEKLKEVIDILRADVQEFLDEAEPILKEFDNEEDK
jgi:hypothetical protein